MRLIDADALLENVQRNETALRNELIVSAHNREIYNNSLIRLNEVLSFEHKIKYAPTVERPRGERMKIYIVVEGNYALSNSMWAFLSKELADGFRDHLRKELDDGMPLHIFELEINEAVLREEDL